MAYPSSIDSFNTKAYGDTVEAAHVNALQTAVAAIETKVGVTGSSIVDSLDYKLKLFFGKSRPHPYRCVFKCDY